MSSTTRPKPRPRPRARAPATASLNIDATSSSSPAPSSATQIQATPALATIEDEDALFLRNRTRTPQTWKQLSRMTEVKETRKRKSSASDSSDEENRDSPRARNRKKRSQPKRKNDALPDWTKKTPKEIVISSDSDSDDDIILESKPRKATKNGDEESSPRSKTKRARSRSITPPPALPQFAIQRAQAAVEQLVGSGPRAVTPTYDADESMDNIALDPELASIAQRVRSEALRGDTPEVDMGGPEEVKLKVVWKPHPQDPDGREDSWGITQKRHTNFSLLFDEIADLAGVRVENMVICYEGKRVFAFSNPHSIGIWAEAELEACDKSTYEYLKEHKRFRSPSVAPFLPHGLDGSRRSPSRARSPSLEMLSESDEGPAPSSPAPQGDNSNTFHLTIRSERTKDKDITLVVRPTTKCGAIVRAFLKKAGLDTEYPADGAPAKGRGRGKAVAKVPVLSVDGDRMDPETEIGEADLEDGDQVEVVGL
ncbi:hypothetical protein L226DRAFT_532365 [Lentinus tigrinus ALCF2SS1-7]|uniref:Uncharacterized protein n=1 Tax=Lentinus tigrinus ALCF2SS1-6 TaxID=1328759 RepID=A0A5C2SH88_9APHY|nr:hypothetical protein L227DRAFT_573183 [Lentinus tigrinus ALCF2SS1-6]RPD77593.1 hypothetical protein L226DRAFT_532365 [Lentinus tigrinus ALCF2SS1-7]